MAHETTADGTNFKSDLHGVGRSVDALKADLNEFAHSAATAARSGASELRDGAHNAMDAAKAKLNDAKHSAADAATSLKDTISRNPVASVGLAVGVGVVIGMLLSRPRS
ncbi:hypothetical protein [Synechococcus sp. Cruz CV-v-12]|uniref:hypothetical protein n=1 Tax=Synechococcus sp. Cruz CV-v-12 TaxID=2823728 RepID=UPI0020CD953A|nr:hypothetical protein [Synechococcus sp. Cruz CV-v-12]MCP9874391.1 DUF883 family protein [Synechococcus sp. Cruz CV-v-12]